MSKKLDPKEVELFLLDNLDFFESRESLVGELKFKHSSSKASSLLERQVLKLRDEHKNLIDLLTAFIDTASEFLPFKSNVTAPLTPSSNGPSITLVFAVTFTPVPANSVFNLLAN